jgi:hypothetical protein
VKSLTDVPKLARHFPIAASAAAVIVNFTNIEYRRNRSNCDGQHIGGFNTG